MIKLSIITVVRNGEDFIEDAIKSVLSQTYPNIEYILIDGASTDKTREIIDKFSFENMLVVSERDSGIYDAMNKGLDLSTGDVVGILNSDDFYIHSQVLKLVADVFECESNVDMVFGDVGFVESSDLTTVVRPYSSKHFSPWKMFAGFMPAHPAAFIRKSAYEQVGNYKLDYNIGADFEWLVRALLVHRLRYKLVDKVFVYMRKGGVSTSGFRSSWTSTKDMYRALASHRKNSYGLVVFRLPVKLLQTIMFKIFRKKKYWNDTV